MLIVVFPLTSVDVNGLRRTAIALVAFQKLQSTTATPTQVWSCSEFLVFLWVVSVVRRFTVLLAARPFSAAPLRAETIVRSTPTAVSAPQDDVATIFLPAR